jgi:hypothetical protein
MRVSQSRSVRGGGDRTEWERADPAVLNQKLKLLWFGCGAEDFAYNSLIPTLASV